MAEIISDEKDKAKAYYTQEVLGAARVKNPKNGYYYRMLNKNPINLAMRQGNGFEIVHAKDGDEALDIPGMSGDGPQELGDMILGKCTEETRQKIAQEAHDKASVHKRATDEVMNSAVEEANDRVGHKTFRR